MATIQNKWIRRIGIVFAGLLAVTIIAVAMLQTPWGLRSVRDLAERQVSNLLVDARLEIGSLSGSILWNLTLDDVRLFAGDSLVASADRVKAGYNLLKIPFGQVDIGRLETDGLAITARQRPDSTWDVLSIVAPSDTAAPDGSAIRISLEDLNLSGTRAEIRPLPDSVEASHITIDTLLAAGIVAGEQMKAEMIRLSLAGRSPMLPDTLRLEVDAEYGEDRFNCNRCLLTTGRTLLSVDGYYNFGSDEEDAGADLTITLDSLALYDLTRFVPAVDSRETLNGYVRLQGPIDSLALASSISTSKGNLEAEGLLVTRDYVVVDLEAAATSVDPSRLWDNSPLSGKLNATISAHLRGPATSSLSGEASLRIFESTLNGRALEGTRLSASMLDGRATIGGAVELPAVRFEIAGEAEPLADTASWNLQGTVDGRDFGATYPVADGLKSFHLAYETSGSTASRADYFRDMAITIDRLVYENFVVDSTALFADRTNGGVKVRGSGRLSSLSTGQQISTFVADSDVRFGETIEIAIRNLGLTNLDIGLAADSSGPLSNVSGTMSGIVKLPSEGRPSGSGSAELRGTLADLPLDSLTLTFRLAQDRLRLDGEFVSDWLALQSEAIVNLSADALPVSLTGRYANLDYGVISGDTAASSNLSGRFEGDVRWRGTANHRIRFYTDLDPSFVNDQEIRAGWVRVTSQNGALSTQSSITTPRGGLNLEAEAQLTDSSFALLGLDGNFDGIRLGALLGLDDLATDLNGSIEISGDLVSFEGFVRLDRSAVNLTTVEGGRIAVGYDRGEATVDATLNLDGGRIRAVGDGRMIEGDLLDLQAMLQIDTVDVAALAGIDSVLSVATLGCSVVGVFGNIDQTDVSGLCLGGRMRYGRASVDSARVQASLRQGLLTLNSFMVRSNVADLDGRGAAFIGTPDPEASGIRSDLELAVTLNDLTPLEDVLGYERLEGEGSLSISLSGRPGRTGVLIEPDLRFLTYNDFRVSSIDGFIQSEDLNFTEAQAVIDVGYSVFSGYPIQQMSMSLLAEPESIIFAADLVQRQGRRASTSAMYIRSSENPTLVIEDLRLNLAGTVWQLNQAAEIERSDVWTISQFLIYHENGQIAIDGQFDLDGEQNVIVTLEQVETSAFVDLFGIEGIAGALEGYLILEGSASEPVISALLRIRDLSSLGIEAGDLSIQMDYADRRLDLSGEMDHVSGHGARISGSLPVDLTIGGEGVVDEQDQLDLVVSADSLPADWIYPFLSALPVDRIGGLFDGDVEIAGTWNDPVFKGQGTVTDGVAGLPDFNTELTDLDAEFRLSDNDLILNRFTAMSGGGSITGTGTVNFETLADLGLNLDVELENFEAIATNTYQFTMSGTAVVTGSMLSPVVNADVSVGPADVYMTEELMADEMETISLTDRDLRILERRFGYSVVSEDTTTSDFVEAMTLDANVNIGRDVWLRSASNPAMDIEFRGDLRIRKAPFDEYRMIGSIDVNPARSRIIQFARRFSIEQGTVTFNGLLEEAVVDFRAVYTVPSRFGGDEVRILLSVTGVMEELELEISSEPQMDDATIASYLLTGRPPGDAVTGEQAAEIAISGVSRMVEAFANENLGLDVVEIETSGTQGARLTVGKYVAPETYVYVSQPLSTESDQTSQSGSRGPEIGLEYELFNWLIAEVASRRGTFRGNLRWQITY